MPISTISRPLLLCVRIRSYATEHRVVPSRGWSSLVKIAVEHNGLLSHVVEERSLEDNSKGLASMDVKSVSNAGEASEDSRDKSKSSIGGEKDEASSMPGVMVGTPGEMKDGCASASYQDLLSELICNQQS